MLNIIFFAIFYFFQVKETILTIELTSDAAGITVLSSFNVHPGDLQFLAKGNKVLLSLGPTKF